ncbi:MAG TPA: TIGR00725 family protein [Candidatus Angelobacter sp.]|nr:TIGR00725 family protein [Candidatus Angelobacter sp.]
MELFRGVASRTAQSSYKRLIQVLVIGSDGDHCPQTTYDAAKEVGAQIAARNAITVTGGLGGVMEAACRGAKEKGGMVVGIIPNEDMSYANPYCDIIIPTGIGFARNFITAYSADVAIVVGGGAGTYIEACVAYQKGKPIVALTGTGGTADKIADTFLDDRKTVKVISASSPRDAVDQALDHAANGKKGVKYFQSVAKML